MEWSDCAQNARAAEATRVNIDDIVTDDEFRRLIPAQQPGELQELEQSLRTEGQRDALVLAHIAGEPKPVLLDGHTRLKLMKSIGLTTAHIRCMDFPDRASAKAWAIRTQLARRNLSITQRIDLAKMLSGLEGAKAKERQIANLRRGDSVPVVANLPERGDEGRTRDKLAKIAGVSGRTFEAAAKVLDKGTPELVAMTKDRKVGVSAAAVVAELPVEEQRQIVKGGAQAVKARAKQKRKPSKAKREQKAEPAAAATTPEKVFDVATRERELAAALRSGSLTHDDYISQLCSLLEQWPSVFREPREDEISYAETNGIPVYAAQQMRFVHNRGIDSLIEHLDHRRICLQEACGIAMLSGMDQIKTITKRLNVGMLTVTITTDPAKSAELLTNMMGSDFAKGLAVELNTYLEHKTEHIPPYHRIPAIAPEGNNE